VKATSFDPVKVPGLTASASGLMTVDDRSCVVQNGEGWCWGWNNHGKLGAGVPMQTMPYSILPVKVAWPF
jgi:alpha-tubulin suppressor-like RCC1 family protein